MDASKAPLRGHFDEVRPLVAVWKDVAEELRVVKQVLAVCKVPRPEEEEWVGYKASVLAFFWSRLALLCGQAIRTQPKRKLILRRSLIMLVHVLSRSIDSSFLTNIKKLQTEDFALCTECKAH